MSRHSFAVLLPLVLGQACFFDEGIVVTNLHGKVILPPEAATREVPVEGGGFESVEDVRFIGPVYLGLYPGVAADIAPYPRPVLGPNNSSYPYGGTTVGDIRYACLPQLTCKVASGRFEDWDSLVDWFDYAYGAPLTRADLQQDAAVQDTRPIEDGEQLREICYDYLRITSDEEARVVASDRNEDGAVDAGDLDFVKNPETGNWEAEFIIWQQEFPEDAVLWGWMDAPSNRGIYSTCNPISGFSDGIYDNSFLGGNQFPFVLNLPFDIGTFLSSGQQSQLGQWLVAPSLSFMDAVDNQPGVPATGDWVAADGAAWVDPYESVELTIDFRVE
jgi:hypothetical protein